MNNLRHAAALGLLVMLAVACRQSDSGVPALGPDVVAVVGGRTVTRDMLEKELARRGASATKETVLEDLIRFEATLAKVREAGFDRDPATIAAVERLLVARFEERELASAEAPSVSDEEVRAFYTTNAVRYTIPAAVRGGVLFLKSSPKATPEKRAAVAAEGERLRALAVAGDGPAFERLVRERSEDNATRYNGGDTGWVGANDSGVLAPAVMDALRALGQPGECAPLVETPGGFHIIRLVGKRPAAIRPLAEVQESIRHQLQLAKREKMTADFQTRLLAGLDIKTNTATLARISVPARATQPPNLP